MVTDSITGVYGTRRILEHIQERSIGTNILLIIQRIYQINRRIFQNQTFQPEYEELSAFKCQLENLSELVYVCDKKAFWRTHPF